MATGAAAWWLVVGGADKGGILVRDGVDLKSPQQSTKLSTWAVVRQVELKGERLHYELCRGTGPAEGWVSLKVSGKDLLVPTKSPAPGVDLEALRLKADADSARYVQGNGEPDPPEWDGLTPPPKRGSFVRESTGRPQAGKFWEPRLPNVPTKLRAVTPFEEHLRAKPRPKFEADMKALTESGEGPIGHWYGLRFPYTLEMIERYGADFLTKALHAAGTLPSDITVTELTAEPFVAGSMSLKCFLRVKYSRPDPELHTDLFVKYPFPAATEHDRKSVYISRFILNNDGPEMDFARILSAGAPMKCPKYYFGDICLKTGTALLITERIPLAGHGEDFGPYELEAIPYKSVDYLLDKPFQYYDAMTRNIACLAAWGKSGRLGADIEDVFPPASLPAAFFMSTAGRVEQLLGLVCQCPCVVAEEVVGPHGPINNDAWLVQTLRSVMPEVEKAQRPILEHLFEDPDYCGFTHQNMNTDNAMFWRDDNGNVCSGFIDWGRFKRDNFARGLSNGYMCCDMCELVQQSDEAWIRNFIESFVESGGPKLKFDVFWEHYMLSWLLQGLAAVDLPRQLALTGSPHVIGEGWMKISSYKDPRIFRLPNYMNGTLAILRNFVYYWTCRDLPAFWERWKRTHLDASLTKSIDEAK